MSPSIFLPDDLYRRLQQHAVPFEDEPAEVIRRLLDHYEGGGGGWDSHLWPVKPPIGPKTLFGREAKSPESAEGDPEPEADTWAKPLSVEGEHSSALNLLRHWHGAQVSQATEDDEEEAGETSREAPPRPGHRRTAMLPGIFLAPATPENLDDSIRRLVPWSVAEEILPSDDVARLRDAIPSEKGFHCWAMTEPRRKLWEAMRPGDVVLFSETGSGSFGLCGTVLTRLESRPLGRRIWDSVGKNPWELIYFLGPIDRIDLDKKTLVTSLGYAPSYRVPGVIRVDLVRVRQAIRENEAFATFVSDRVRAWRGRSEF